MGDEELRALERLARAGDRAARLRLQRALARAHRPLDDAWEGLARVAPGAFERAERLPDAQRAAFEDDLAALDPARLRAHRPRDAAGAPARGVVLAEYRWPGQRFADPWLLVADAAEDGAASIDLVEQGLPRHEVPGRWAWDAREPAATTAVAWVPGGGGAVVFATSDGEVRWARADGADARAVGCGPAPVLALGCRRGAAAWVAGDALHVASLAPARGGDAARAPVRLDLPLPGATCAAFSDDLVMLAVTDGTALAVLDVATGATRWSLTDARYDGRSDVPALHGLAFSPDRAHVAAAGGAVVVRVAATGELHDARPVLHGRETNTWSDNKSTMGLGRDEGTDERWPCAVEVAWVGSGRLVSVGTDRALRLWTLGKHACPGPPRTCYGEDVTSRVQPFQTTDGEVRAVKGPLARARDGARVALPSSDGAALHVVGVSATLTDQRVLRRPALAAAFDDSGRVLALGLPTGEVQVVAVDGA